MNQQPMIPNDLTELDQWVLWRSETRKGRLTKVPYQSNGQLASSTDPRTWETFERINAELQRSLGNGHKFSGLGFVFSPADPYCGIDLDDCLDSDGQPKAWAQPIIQRFADTYMEISPSGHGVKIWTRAKLPGSGKKTDYQDGAIELYDCGRYFTLTGQVLNGAPLQIEAHQAEVDELYLLISGGVQARPKADITDSKPIVEGGRHDYLLSVAAQFGARGMSQEEIFAATQALNLNRCKPPKSAEEVRKACEWVWERERSSDRAIGQPEQAPDAISLRAGAKGTNVAELAGEICHDTHFARDPGGRLYVFKDGVYKPAGELFVQQRVKGIMSAWDIAEKWTSRKAKEVAEYIRVDAPMLWDTPSNEVVNVANGLLNVRTQQLQPHSAEFLSPIQISVSYDPAAKCPFWDQFIADVFPFDSEAVAWEILAWLMTPDTSIQKAVLLTGEGANGKSTYLRAVVAFIGKHNTSALSLHRLEQDKFSVARLVGKLANICPDLPSTHLASTSMFKALTGGDVLQAECKYLDSFEFVPFAKLLFSANQPPRSDDPTHGFFRRWLVVPFTRTFEEGATDTVARAELDARLSDPGELSGVLNKALLALASLRKRRGFTESGSMQQAWAEFRTATDALSVWLDQNTVDLPNVQILQSELAASFNKHMADAGKPSMTKTAFGLALKRARPNVESCQRTHMGRPRQWVYSGIALRIEPREGNPDA